MTAKKLSVKATPKHIGIVASDPYLEPYEAAIRGRHEHALWKIGQLTRNGRQTLSDFANGYKYFGLHKVPRGGWVFREWAPTATDIYLVGDFNNWTEDEKYRCKRIEGTGNWELKLPAKAMKHGQLYKMHVKWDGGEGERIPAWCQRVVQDEVTKIFSAQVWAPKTPYQWKKKNFKANTNPLLIYECHVGMGQDAEKVGTYTEFKDNVLPRVAKDGYNCIQVMAIQEHPYYGSFGYHVSSFFAPSSRFGTPEELKALIDAAHQMGISVVMDIVHSHAVKNEVEGLGNLAGDPNQYFYPGDRHEHPAWDSLCFDYGKDDVIHFLLSNCKYWLEEFHFDGFRFDGVTSMLYYSHGLGEAFTNYGDYFNGHEDDNAICYLTLANKLIHEVNPKAITIAEEVSGMPGLAAKFEDGGYGFNYRMAMNIPDYWIKTIKERRDEDWKPSSIFWEVKNRRADEQTISYCESHDQALVGDKTIIFRLIDADMYWHFKQGDENDMVHRGIALHKMIRLVTLGTINGGYLNFMGNEFGHPEWIDFPREGNGWSYKYARRQWNLVDNPELDYHFLGDFDRKMIEVVKGEKNFIKTPVQEIWHNDGDQVLAFMRGDLVFVFNFSPTRSFTDYGFLVPEGDYKVVLNSDAKEFGGNGFADDTMVHHTNFDPVYEKDHKGWLKLYIPARSAVVLKKDK
ncbi:MULTISPECIES: alpha amylase C-terminal domain-containing protein [Hallella]|uniref:1,4-alpha-glucan branching enzyme n=1 Tax=Hallella faecis TaxID=2841596 RepID=A0ABV1FRV0_9BACT|nr:MULTISPECIES: alpha amylase C-terminal domain-containing protein [Hallella]MBS7400418.1 alpha amylase C-terminal domain-containing protein [Prevotella sp.]MBU0290330.1 alpha amylase C-terminal domain-containing protein [Hallella faecis]MDD7145390.1 alpha amylase C-terminal domain-containing protein [Hallella sp.]MDR3845373.1 alpha amylase C-terminal domain-containing protein [Hallella sp.]MDR4000991.1 alpha amylase C-terminal domain-containing protein [Hallella sp.]